MGVIFNPPSHPVVDSNPGFWKVVNNFNTQDYINAAAITVAGQPLTYYFALDHSPYKYNMKTRSAVMNFSMVAFAAAGALYAYQSSAARLMGYKPNADEVAAAKKTKGSTIQV
mmetsp:Transcript_6961/g.25638  ORF Transcript_6961/g.25638 Transcript_6961/m.25638 type:complete len:113 (-) Transcript_6961:106-444(-)